MKHKGTSPLKHWPTISPLLACAILAMIWGVDISNFAAIGVACVLMVCVSASVHHAEALAHRLGEPYGALILALAVTIIEVSLIISLMISGVEGKDTLARDTVFATVMIICNGIVGLCLFAGAIRNHVAVFRVEGSNPSLAVLIALTTLSLVLPQFTTTTAGPTYSESQLLFAGLMSLLLFGVYIFVQTVKHREDFLPIAPEGDAPRKPLIQSEQAQRGSISNQSAAVSFLFLCLALAGVVGLAKTLSPTLEDVVQSGGAPTSFVGVVIALIVLLPETGAAFNAAIQDRMQISLNLALGSALATIGLTIPAIGFVSIALNLPITLGLSPKEIVLLVLTFGVSMVTLARGQATILHGAVHLVIFAAFLFLSIVP